MSTSKDYVAILARTIVANGARTWEERQTIYQRARHALRRADLPDEDLQTELRTLETAIERVEMDALAIDPFPDAEEGEHVSDARVESYPRGARAASPMSSSTRSVRPALIASGLAFIALAIAIGGYFLWPSTAPKRQADEERPASRSRVASAVNVPESASKQTAAYVSARQLVYYRSTHPAGTIIISKSQRFLYLVRPDVVAVRYAMGLGNDCAKAVGLLLVSSKEDWSDAAARLELRARWGLRSLSLSDSGYRIHGAASMQNPREFTIGCFPLRDDDIVDLYDRVALGAKVVIN